MSSRTRIYAVVVGLTVLLATANPVSANTVTWNFDNADPAGTDVSGFVTFNDVVSSAPGTTWQISDISNFSINYDGVEIASFASPGLSTFFGDSAGISIREFTATTPFLPFVSTEFGDFRSQLYVLNAFSPNRIFTIEGSLTGETYLFCFSSVTPNETTCNDTSRDLVSLVWSASPSPPTAVPEPTSLVLLSVGGLGLLAKARHRNPTNQQLR